MLFNSGNILIFESILGVPKRTMKIYCFLPLLLFLHYSLSAQTDKGVKPIRRADQSALGAVTRAVVVGISDYQDPDIPDLRFAHRDAEVFAQFLRSSAGGQLPDSCLVVLINRDATAGRFAQALDWLIQRSREGDNALIYFSGHCDVETDRIGKPGYLLCWNAPAQVYMGGGTVNLRDLQEVVATLNLERKAKVSIITDVCRAGRLAGSSINGPQITNNSIYTQFNNDIRILSCQPDEYSIEGEQWGGGRGAFSFHLVNGMYGMADADADGVVSLLEVGRYLEDRVPREVAPFSQMPMVVGNKTIALASVVPGLLDSIRRNGATHSAGLMPSDRRNIDAAFASADSSAGELYRRFCEAIESGRFFEPADACADHYFRLLMQRPDLDGEQPGIIRYYAAALQDDAQQAINALLKADYRRLTQSNRELIAQYGDLPRLLERAAEVLGEDHYFYASLKARQHLFEGVLLGLQTFTSLGKDPVTAALMLEKYRLSLRYEPESPPALFYMSLCFATRLEEPDSARLYAEAATRYAETWVLPYAYMAHYYSRLFDKPAEAKEMLDKAMAIDSANVFVWKSLGSWYFYQNRIEEGITAFERAAALEPGNAVTWVNIGSSYMKLRRFEAAEAALLRSVALDANQYNAYLYLGKLYAMTQRPEAAERMLLRAIAVNPNNSEGRTDLARLYLQQERWKEAEVQYLEIVRHDEKDPWVWYHLAELGARDGRQEEGLRYLEKALEKGFSNRDELLNGQAIATLRKTSGFQTLMERFGVK